MSGLKFDQRALDDAHAQNVVREAIKRQLESDAAVARLQPAADTIDPKACFREYSEAYVRDGKFPNPIWMSSCRSPVVPMELSLLTQVRPHYEYNCTSWEDARQDEGKCHVVLLPSYFQ